jgi:hypothetical protein
MKLTVDGGRWTRPSIVAALLLFAACRTARLPSEEPLPPVNAPTAEAALTALRDRMTKLVDVHALVRVRVTTPERTDSFKAAVTVNGREQMELTIYTPINTTAATITSDGQNVTIRDVVHGATVKATSADLARAYGIFLPDQPPSDMALVLLGFPAISGATYEAEPTGLRRASAGDAVIDFEPPVQPVQSVRITRPAQTVEVSVLESVGRWQN